MWHTELFLTIGVGHKDLFEKNLDTIFQSSLVQVSYIFVLHYFFDHGANNLKDLVHIKELEKIL